MKAEEIKNKEKTISKGIYLCDYATVSRLNK